MAKKKSASKAAAKTKAKKTTKRSAAKKSAAVAKSNSSKKTTTKSSSKKRASAGKSANASNNGAASPKTQPAKPRTRRTAARKTTKPPATAIAAPSTSLTSEDHKPPTLTQIRKAASGLSRQEKEVFRRLLVEKRTEILGDVESLHRSALGEGGELSHMPLHMADVGTDQYEQEATLGLMETELKLLRQVDEALERLRNGTYGVCLETGKPIEKARLEYKPWAKYCIEVVRERERLGRS